MGELILNCDLGEDECAAQTEQLMALVGAANICCGVHAGSAAKTRATLELAKRYGVMVGAHPGLAIAGGRGSELPSAVELDALLQEQLGCFLRIAGEVDVPVRYVKLHGTLYHAVEQDDALADVTVGMIKALDNSVGIFSLAGGRLAQLARRKGRFCVGRSFCRSRLYARRSISAARSTWGLDRRRCNCCGTFTAMATQRQDADD